MNRIVRLTQTFLITGLLAAGGNAFGALWMLAAEIIKPPGLVTFGVGEPWKVARAILEGLPESA